MDPKRVDLDLAVIAAADVRRGGSEMQGVVVVNAAKTQGVAVRDVGEGTAACSGGRGQGMGNVGRGITGRFRAVNVYAGWWHTIIEVEDVQ